MAVHHVDPEDQVEVTRGGAASMGIGDCLAIEKFLSGAFFLKVLFATGATAEFTPAMLRWNVGKRTLLRVDGADAVRYLNGQLTQDVQRAVTQRGDAFATCVTDAKGRLQAYGSVFSADGSSVFLEAPLELRESLQMRIEKYLIADDAEIVDVSDGFFLVHEVAVAVDGGMAGEPRVEDAGAGMAFRFSRLGVAGVDHWLPSDVMGGAGELTWHEAEAMRIQHGEPRWGAELVDGVLPPEAGLEARAISYTKGCYIGQEVISRMKTAGKVNRRLTRFFIDAADDLAANLAGEDVWMGESAVGQITSHAGAHAIGWIKKNAFQETTLRTRSGVELRREVE